MNPKQEKINKIKTLLMGKQFNILIEKMDRLAQAIEKKPEPHIVNQVPAELRVSNIADMPTAMDVKNFPASQKVFIENHKDTQNVKIENHKEVQKVELTNGKEVQKVQLIGEEKTSSWAPVAIAHAVKGIVGAWVKLWEGGITVKLDDEERLKPLPVIVVDYRGKPVKMGGEVNIMGGFMPGSQSTGGAIGTGNSFGSGRKTSSTPGTAVPLAPSVTPCRKVVVTAFAGNTDAVYIGGTNVSGVSGQEKGILLTGIGMTTIEINDLSKIWMDVVSSGDGVSFSYIS